MTRAVYVNADPVNGPAKARTLNCGWFPEPPAFLVAVIAGRVPCAVVEGVTTQVFPEPITPSQVSAAIAAGIAADATAAAAQAVLDGNASTLRSRAQTALATNATFLAIASPTAAQVAAQSKALTRQVNGVIRLLLNVTADITDA